MDLRQDAAITRRQGCLRYGGVIGSWAIYGARYGRLDCGGGRSSENASCPYILRHRVWSDWAIFLNIFADLSLSNVLDEKFSAALAQAGSGKRQKQLISNLLQAIGYCFGLSPLSSRPPRAGRRK